jgi:hypothetical protein
MTTNRAAIAAILAAVVIAGCASQPSTTNPTAIPAAKASPSTTPSSAAAAAFGTSERVTDAQGRLLTVTPVKAWWLPGDIQSRYIPQAAASGLSPAEHGRFLIVEMKVEAVSGTAYFPAPITGAGPAIISGHQVFTDMGTNASNNVVWDTCLAGVDSNVPLHPGSWLLDGETFDVPPGPAVLAWLVGTQGASAATWQVPAHSTGALPANVRTALKTGNGC